MKTRALPIKTVFQMVVAATFVLVVICANDCSAYHVQGEFMMAHYTCV